MKAYENYKKYSHAACILIYSHALSTKYMEDCIKSKFKAKRKIILKMLSIKTEILTILKCGSLLHLVCILNNAWSITQ